MIPVHPPSQVRAVLLRPVDASAPHTAAALCDRGLFTVGALQPVVSLSVFCVSLPHLLFLPPLPHDPPFFLPLSSGVGSHSFFGCDERLRRRLSPLPFS